MKARMLQRALGVAVATAVLALLVVNGLAQAPASTNAVPQLTPNVAAIVKLVQAKVSDDTIVAYIKNSGNSYGLDAEQIIYLHQHGISDAVINAMLNQPKAAGGAATVETPNASAPPPAALSASASTVETTPLYSPRQKGQLPAGSANTSTAATSTATVAPTVTYVQTAPPTYYYQPYYYNPYPAYFWPFPPVALSFGWGGHWGGGWHR